MADDLEALAAAEVEQRVGHPGEKWDALQYRIQSERLKEFAAVEDAWVELMWTLDAYRIANLPPRGMGGATANASRRLAAVYRGKGNWFATLLALLLENQTSHPLAPRVNVQGFSQAHQIDVAWPSRNLDPLICLETKVTGAPAHNDTPARRATGDWSNRRKELKFAATDLKLFRRQNLTSIEHWDFWRANTSPSAYFLWAARMTPRDSIDFMVREVQALVKTYLDAAGIVAWREGSDTAPYELVPIPQADRVSTVDDVLYRIATEIRTIAPPGQEPPPPEIPEQRTVDISRLEADAQATDE
jgi:hypothetical protein